MGEMNGGNPHQLKGATYDSALRKAWRELEARGLDQIPKEVKRGEGGYLVPMFGEDHFVQVGDRRVTMRGEEDHPFIKVLILHYLLGCGRSSTTGRLITFREVPGGEMYYPAFKRRAIDTLVRVFGHDPPLLLKAGEQIGAERGEIGSASVVVKVFPGVLVTAVIWEGDEEVPSSGNILFDSSIVNVLPMEDVSIVGNLVSSRLRKAATRTTSGIDRHPEVTTRG